MVGIEGNRNESFSAKQAGKTSPRQLIFEICNKGPLSGARKSFSGLQGATGKHTSQRKKMPTHSDELAIETPVVHSPEKP
jgi:hypothetical protein